MPVNARMSRKKEARTTVCAELKRTVRLWAGTLLLARASNLLDRMDGGMLEVPQGIATYCDMLRCADADR